MALGEVFIKMRVFNLKLLCGWIYKFLCLCLLHLLFLYKNKANQLYSYLMIRMDFYAGVSFFGYTGLVCVGLFLVLGCVGHHVSEIFVKRIYRGIRLE